MAIVLSCLHSLVFQGKCLDWWFIQLWKTRYTAYFLSTYILFIRIASAIIHLWFLCEWLIFLALGEIKQRWNEENWETKGQMKSECIYEIIDFPKYHWKNLIDFCPENLFRIGMLYTHLRRVALRINKTNHMYLFHKIFHGRNLACNFFSVVFWKIDDFINTFWHYLTFRSFSHDRPSQIFLRLLPILRMSK